LARLANLQLEVQYLLLPDGQRDARFHFGRKSLGGRSYLIGSRQQIWERVESGCARHAWADDPGIEFLYRELGLGNNRAGFVRDRAGERCSGHLSVNGCRKPEAKYKNYEREKTYNSLCGTDFRKHGASRSRLLVFVPGAYDLKSDGKGRPPEPQDFLKLQPIGLRKP
jgi:hypothetical protein